MKGFIITYAFEIIIFCLALNMILFLALLIEVTKNKSLKKRFIELTSNQDFKNLEDIIRQTNEKVEYFEEVLKALTKSHRTLSENTKLCIKKVGIIRYDAFENVGSRLSFALALLDEFDTGVVINSIYSREGCSVYAKPIENGISKYPLSAEEMQAIDIARKNYISKEIKE
ncbi:DUF4446 family protein [Anaerocellum diazotrophicum]|uniref:DUF4446 domain-containing protein n=1 Tax=Caldicellulosiruptor diazotrophicus TaxID=2806205 RepID=A0ABM7NQQ6_9FIRM|nr:DUF4446 family protein [Caldicellulosiruptor diazotrophicus]BCS82459.1 hypothetical protein CaldiYA01_24190 [Caldicellulosiruptor diazotrophicus]